MTGVIGRGGSYPAESLPAKNSKAHGITMRSAPRADITGHVFQGRFGPACQFVGNQIVLSDRWTDA
jgi:GDP-D-mannose dehydratase